MFTEKLENLTEFNTMAEKGIDKPHTFNYKGNKIIGPRLNIKMFTILTKQP